MGSAGIGTSAKLPAATASTPGAQSAADQAALNLSRTITDSGSAAVGDIVRIVSDGVVAKAQADSAAHAAGQIGIWDGATVVPLIGFRRINCVAAPTVGLPLYLSAATAGKGSALIPNLGVSPIGQVIADVSVGAAYAALVSCPYQPIVEAVSLKQKLDAETLALLGGSVDDWDDAIFDHFAQTNVSSGVRVPTWGVQSAATWAATNTSCVTMDTGGGKIWYTSANGWSRMGTSPLAFPWRLSTRIKVPAGAWSGTGIDWYRADGSGHMYFTLQANGTHWQFGYGPSGEGSATLGAKVDANFAALHVISFGDGTFATKMDSGAWSAPFTDANLAAMNGAITGGALCMMQGCSAGGVTCDWVYYRQKLS